MTRSSAAWIAGAALAVTVATSSVAHGGGQFCTDSERAEAARARRKWRRRGRAAVPQMIGAIVHRRQRRNLCLQLAAEDQLEGYGLHAARRVLRAMKRRGALQLPSVMTKLLCSRLTGRGSAAGWRALHRRLVAAIGARDQRGASAAIGTLAEVAARERTTCGRYAELAPYVRAGLLALRPLLVQTHPLCGRAIDAVRAARGRGAVVATALVPLLTDARHRSAAVSALAALGAGAAPAVSALRGLLGRGLVDGRVRIAWAVGKIGKTAAAARPELLALLAQIPRDGRWQNTSRMRTVLDAIAAVGGAANASQHAALLAVLRDDASGFAARRAAAKSLANVALAARDQRVLAAIRSKAKLLRVHLYPQPQRVPPPAVSAARRLRYALTVCRAEAGRTPAATSGMMKHATRANAAMALCLSERLCGPSTAAMHGAIRRCCAAASYASPPSWCR